MKKLLILLLPILITGCNDEQKTYEEDFKQLANQYYEEFLSSNEQIKEYTISLKTLKDMNDNNKYNLETLNNCDEESTIAFTIEPETKTIIEYNFNLKCD